MGMKKNHDREKSTSKKLLLTVSGGLEDLAEQQIRSSLQDDSHKLELELDWHRGPSGSQLYLTLSLLDKEGSNSNSETSLVVLERTIANLIQRMDFVDYVFVLVDSLQLENEKVLNLTASPNEQDTATASQHSQQYLLQQIKTVSQTIDTEAIAFCERICNTLENDDSENDTCCLEGRMPGVLLPPLELDAALEETGSKDNDPSTTKEDSIINPPASGREETKTNINTIYTKDAVAKAVVERILEFCNQQHHTLHNSNNNNSKQTLPPTAESTFWIDAGSGNGALLRHLPIDRSIGIDTNPTTNKSTITTLKHQVLRMDFLKTSKEWIQEQQHLQETHTMFTNIAVVSNPPFSESTRGDYTPIVKFINHSLEILGAKHVAIICPTKFAKPRIWKSLDLTPLATLTARFFLPTNAFVNPATKASVHIHSCCLLFGNNTHDNLYQKSKETKSGIYLSSKRDKGVFPNLATTTLTSAMVSGMAGKLQLVAERNARYMLQGRLTNSCQLEFWWKANCIPCSLRNSTCRKVPNHSLGWLSLSCKPSVALAMCTIALQPKGHHPNEEQQRHNNNACVAINLMSGEGTIELESNRASKVFWIGGDKSFERARKTAQRLRTAAAASSSRQSRHHLVDMVVWDAQNLPLRKGFADALLADLPFQGSFQKVHQEPFVGECVSPPQKPVLTHPLDYSKVFQHACRILRPKGRAALLSPDGNALKHASGKFHWSSKEWGYSSKNNISLGGLSGKLFLMERSEGCTKDISMWVPSSTNNTNWSSWILALANEACCDEETNVVTGVRLHSTYYHEQKQKLSHCYRMYFDDEIKNIRAKDLEQQIRRLLEKHLREGMSLR